MTDQSADELQAERDARIAELEARQRAGRGVGVRAPVALLGLLLGLGLLWLERHDVAYLLAPREPLTLGTEGDYHFERLASNRYAQVHGRPTTLGAYGVDGGRTVVMVGLQDTPVVVRRGLVDGEDWAPGRAPPQPSQAPFAVRGRLLREDEDPRFAEGFRQLRATDQLRPRDGALWVLVESERPGADRATVLSAGALVLLVLVNAWLLGRAFNGRRRSGRRGQSRAGAG